MIEPPATVRTSSLAPSAASALDDGGRASRCSSAASTSPLLRDLRAAARSAAALVRRARPWPRSLAGRLVGQLVGRSGITVAQPDARGRSRCSPVSAGAAGERRALALACATHLRRRGPAAGRRLAACWDGRRPRPRCVNIYGPTETPHAMALVRAAAGVSPGERLGEAIPIGAAHRGLRSCSCSTARRACAGRRAGRALRGRRGLAGATSAAGAHRGALRPRSRSGPARARASTGPATSARYRPDGDARVPRPHRPPGQDPRLPHRAGRDRGGARARTRRCARRWCWRARTRPGDKRLVAYVVRASRARRRAGRAARLPRGAAARATWCRRRSSLLDGAAAHAQRQGRPAGAARAGGGGRRTRPRTSRRAARWRRLLAGDLRRGAEARRGARRRARRLLRAGGHSLLATRRSRRAPRRVRRRAAAARALRGADGARSWPARVAAALGGAGRRARRAVRSSARPRQDRRPLSFAQERLWFLDQLDPGRAPLQHLPRRCASRARSTRRARARASSEIVRRHEVLRTTLRRRWTGRPFAGRPAARGRFPLPMVDLAGLPEAEREAEARRRGARRRRAGRSTSRGARCSARTLVRLGERGARAAADAAPHRLRRAGRSGC